MFWVFQMEIFHMSNYEILKLKKKIKSKIDIKNFKQVRSVIKSFKPNFIFHLAAEAIVQRSYKNPKKLGITL